MIFSEYGTINYIVSIYETLESPGLLSLFLIIPLFLYVESILKMSTEHGRHLNEHYGGTLQTSSTWLRKGTIAVSNVP